MNKQKNLSILYINTYGQTKYTIQKQLQIEDIVKKYKSDIIHLQESQFDAQSFEHCQIIKSNFSV